MNSCGKKVAVIFGFLILLAVLFVPYKETKINIYEFLSAGPAHHDDILGAYVPATIL